MREGRPSRNRETGIRPIESEVKMKSAFWRLVSLALFCPALLTAQSALNLNFQNTTYNLPDGWYFGGGPFQYSIDTSTTYSSTQSLKIASLGADTTQFGDASLILSAPRLSAARLICQAPSAPRT